MDRQVELLLSQLRSLVAAKLNEPAESISLDRPVLWYGFDSLACVELGFAFEETCGFALPLEELLAGASIRDVVSILREPADAPNASGSSDGGLTSLTPQEKALWIDHQLDPSGSAYNLARAFWTETDATLTNDFQRLADRFATLRTTVSEHNGEPFFHCLPAMDGNVVEIDAAGWPIDALRARAVVEAEHPFTPGNPLWRVALFRTEDRTLVVFAIHHLIADMQSLTAIASSFDSSEHDGRIASLTHPPRPGVRNFVPSEKTEMLDGFWEGQLNEWPATVQIPADFPSSSERGRGGQIRVETGPGSRQAITDLAHRHHCTAFPPLLAAYAALIHRWTGQRDFAIGCPVSLRSGPATNNDRGYRVSPLPIRIRIPEAATYSQLVRSVRDTANGVIAHRETSLLAVKKRIGNASPFNAMFVYHPGGGSEQDLSALVAERDGARFRLGNRECHVFASPRTTCLGGLRMEAVESGDDYQLMLEYCTDRFREETMLTFANSFSILLGRMLASPDTPIIAHPLTSPEERLQLTIGYNSTRTEYPDRLPVPEAIGRQAASTPLAVAVEFGEASLSYAALETHSNRLARRLRALGAAPETFVGVAMERSIELPVVLLAIMKTGAAYVPLDPHGPPERLHETIRDANISIRITHNRFAGDFRDCVTVEAEDWEGWTGDSGPLGLAVESESAAYLIYTSGSTGRPKGVVNTHSALANRLNWMQDEFRIGSGDAVLQKTPLTFDVSVWELFWPLMNGARLVLARPGGHRDAEYLCGVIRRHCITVIHFVPSMLNEFLNYPETAHLPSLRHVVLSGEELKRDVALRCMNTIGARLSNLYGPTEAAIDVSWHVCSREERGRVPIGRPIANVELHILDQGMEPVPTGMVGHLYIGGAGLSRGYRGQPSLTASCFVPNPFGSTGSRLYRTGDLARRQAGGAIEYMGRLDGQVKVGGVRIELGELEIAAMEHPNIASAYARLIQRGSADRLGCYLVPRRAPGPGLAELREFLARRLAPAMLPSWTMDVEAAAFSSSGKLDRRALPEPVLTQDAACEDFEPPDFIEEQFLAICAEVLERNRCNSGLSFPIQGGSSLDAIRVASRMRTEVGCVVPLDALLSTRPLSAIRAEVSRATQFESPIPPPGPVERPAQIPLSYEQERLWFMDQLLPRSTGYVVVQGVGIEGALDAGRVGQALGALLERHEILRTTFSDWEGQPTQRLHAAGVLDFESIEGNSDTVQEHVCILGQTPFVLSRLPLARFRLVRVAEGEHVLLVAMHHIITDGWTFGILLRDFLERYAAEPDKRPVLQYADYALWQRKYLTEKALQERLAYWTQALAGAKAASIPADRRRPAVQSFAGRELRQKLSPETVSKLESAARSHSATMFMAMLGAFAVLLSRYNNETDISVAIPAANRHHPALERAAGFFANTLVSRIDLAGDPSFEQVLVRVRKVALEAFHHSEAPFEKVIEALQPGRDLSMPPLIRSMFAYQNAPLPRMNSRDFRLRKLSFDTGVVRYDMRLSIESDGDCLEAAFQFNSDLYTPGTMERTARHFEVLLNALAADPARRISELPLQTEQERKYWRDAWNDTRTSSPRRRLEELFFESTARDPEAIALTAGTVRMSYGELAARSGRLAHLLSERAVSRGELVAVVMEKGWEQVVAVLGVLRAGAAYLPIDAGVPAKRLETLLRDGRVRIALTQAKLLRELEWSEGLQAIAVDRIDVSIECQPPPLGDDLDLAYVIYTSGSTGSPKGVMITHRAAVNTILHVNHQFQIGPRDRVLAISSLSFDLSVWDIFGVLAAGGTIVLPENGNLSDPRHWRSLIEAEGITIWNSVPALVRMLIESVGPSVTLPTLRLALLSGDWIPLSLPADVRRLAPMAETISLGGATEASIWSILYPVKEVDPEWRSIPYGRPMANQRVYVFDRHFEVCPPGVSGRIWIGGDGVAAGYWNDPEKTAASFVNHPASGERLYSTGDLGRYHPDGYIELLGREDLQLKVGGFRIEPGEVEAALLTHASVQSCVVTAQRPHEAEPVLVAFVVSKGRAAGSAELQAFLRGLLPHYSVPSAIGFLDALPLSPNGKIDLKALPLVTHAVTGDVWPKSRMEQLVAGVLSEAMEGAQVVMDRNFFELGATSLSLVRAQRMLEMRIGRELPVIDLFRHSTIRALAAHLESRTASIGAAQTGTDRAALRRNAMRDRSGR
jgi:amino acid adenylation domain-containing protein